MSEDLTERIPDLGPLFLQALEFPTHARPEVYMKAQKKSGWSKAVFLRTLLNEWEHYDTVWQIHANKERTDLRKQGNKLPEDFGVDLEKETNGKQKGKLTRKALEDLRFAVEQAYKFEVPDPVFDSFQIIAFCERLLLFIKGQYEEQIMPYHSVNFVVERLKKAGHRIKGNPTHVVYHYNIITDAPVGDFYRFKTEVRKLLLNSVHPEELKTILTPVKELCIKIVDLWNNDLQSLDQPIEEKDRNRAVREQRLMTFNYWDISMWHRNIQFDDEFYREPSLHFMNRDFAVFAANVANLITYEVLKQKKTTKNFNSISQEYRNFDELFINPHTSKEYYNLLVEEQLIGPNFNYIGGLKSAFCIWVKELSKQGVIHFISDDDMTVLLNNKFASLRMSSSLFRSTMTKAVKEYQPKFKKEISKLKQG